MNTTLATDGSTTSSSRSCWSLSPVDIPGLPQRQASLSARGRRWRQGLCRVPGDPSDPNHPEYDERLEWIGGEFDPEGFDAKEVDAALASLVL